MRRLGWIVLCVLLAACGADTDDEPDTSIACPFREATQTRTICFPTPADAEMRDALLTAIDQWQECRTRDERVAVPYDAYDLASVLVHELGHLYLQSGEHSNDTDSVMYPSVPRHKGVAKRHLGQADIDALKAMPELTALIFVDEPVCNVRVMWADLPHPFFAKASYIWVKVATRLPWSP